MLRRKSSTPNMLLSNLDNVEQKQNHRVNVACMPLETVALPLSHFTSLKLMGGSYPHHPSPELPIVFGVLILFPVRFPVLFLSEALSDGNNKVFCIGNAQLWQMLTIIYTESHDYKFFLDLILCWEFWHTKYAKGALLDFKEAFLHSLIRSGGHDPSGPQFLCPCVPFLQYKLRTFSPYLWKSFK